MNKLIILFTTVLITTACAQESKQQNFTQHNTKANTKSVVFAMGCFWCVEEIFEQIKGVEEVVSGYSGGEESGANYRAVSSGFSDHVEAVKIIYNPKKISFDDLLLVYFNAGDITQVNGQGPDNGKQYRSVLFYKDAAQKQSIIQYIKQLKQSGKYPKGIAVDVQKFKHFYAAEDYHQDFVKNNPSQGYVRNVSKPRCSNALKKIPSRLLK